MISAVPSDIIRYLRERQIDPTDFQHSHGGCVNNGGKLSTGEDNFFLKWNDAGKFPGLFDKESKGLRQLAGAGAIRIPEPKLVGTVGSYTFLVMEFIEQGISSPNFFELMGARLAAMHRVTNDQFGLDHDNYIGSLPQKNTFHSDWIEFFIVQRLLPQVKLGVDTREIPTSFVSRMEQLFSKLGACLPIEAPSLLHGDLWSGNFIMDEKGEPCLIDPAVYFGNREVDLAFSRLFGGFDSEFYESYHTTFPLQADFEERVDIYNLYPLLVHVNLFGGGYFSQVKSIVKRFS